MGCLNNVELGGGNVKGIDVGSKTGEGLLGTVGAGREYVSYILEMHEIQVHTGSGC